LGRLGALLEEMAAMMAEATVEAMALNDMMENPL
jgi:hypothetical protein